MRKALVTGFEGYGGRGRNPAGETALALDGHTVEGTTILGRRLPVSFKGLGQRLEDLIDETAPDIVISLGLWPGTPMIQVERVAINVADFEIPDNEGAVLRDQPVSGNGPVGLLSTLPIRGIRDALLKAGIPARLSSTAGTFLCNATLYTTLHHAARKSRPPLTGFIHIPYLPEQVAEMLGTTEQERRLELHQRSDFASMDLGTMVRAVEIAVATAARHLG